MSQASRPKWRAAQRRRERVARAIAAVELSASVVCGMCHGAGVDFDCECDCPRSDHAVYHRDDCQAVWCKLCDGTGSGRRALAMALLSDPKQGFDVHAAREHAREMVDQATVRAGKHRAAGRAQAAEQQGQWVGLGRAILDALEGQPSECQACEGRGTLDPGPLSWERLMDGSSLSWDAMFPEPCPDCQGTGHNLRGVLPEVEPGQQMRRRIAEATASGSAMTWPYPHWLDDLGFEHGIDRSAATRAIPRGEHRDDGEIWSPPSMAHHAENAAEHRARRLKYMPRWRRGELRHAEKRRARERRYRQAAEARGETREAPLGPWS